MQLVSTVKPVHDGHCVVRPPPYNSQVTKSKRASSINLTCGHRQPLHNNQVIKSHEDP